MNKTILVAGGASLASLAAGAVGGYFFAQNRLGKAFDERLEAELEATKRYYGRLLAEAHEKPKPSLDELVKKSKTTAAQMAEHLGTSVDGLIGKDSKDGDEPIEDEPTDEQILAQEARQVKADTALTDYRGASAKASEKNGDSEVVSTNIFADAPKTQRPPRDPENGRFIPRNSNESTEDDPQIITQEEFLDEVPDGFVQENLRYFIKNKTLLDTSDEVVDIERVGEVNLTLFPEQEPDARFPAMICVRNRFRRQDYEVMLIQEDIGDYLNLGGGDDSDSDQAAWAV